MEIIHYLKTVLCYSTYIDLFLSNPMPSATIMVGKTVSTFEPINKV